jgi:hypothetical protein
LSQGESTHPDSREKCQSMKNYQRKNSTNLPGKTLLPLSKKIFLFDLDFLRIAKKKSLEKNIRKELGSNLT